MRYCARNRGAENNPHLRMPKTKDLFSENNLARAANFLWALILVTLPVTTFRYIPGPLGRTIVKPLALYPLALILPVLFLLFWRQRRIALPPNIRPLLAFLLFAMIASFAGAFYAPLPLRGAEFDERVLRGWLSLAIGLVFFFVAFWMNRDEKDLQRSLKWIYIGLVITLAWSFVQALAINTSLIPRHIINSIQLIFSDRPLLTRRISGFAYEPAWLADQLVAFYMPWLFAAILLRRPFTRRAWLEPVLLALSLVVLVFTYSRGGLASAAICMAVVGLLSGRSYLQSAWAWLQAPLRSKRARTAAALAGRVAIFAGVAVAAVLVVSFLSRYEYFASLWELGDETRPLDYVVDISAGPRLAYLVAGYRVYEQAPLPGVGLGASGLYLLQRYPDWSYVIPEIARQLSPDSNLVPNIKSLYVRLLAETGLPGLWFFLAFMLSFLAYLRRMWLARSSALRFVAVAGLFAWLALALRNSTQDSFTFPIMWVILGVLAGIYPADSKQETNLIL
jgi:O-antigen ligase